MSKILRLKMSALR